MPMLFKSLLMITIMFSSAGFSVRSLPAAPLATSKAETGAISGSVRDGDGKGLAGASVTLTSHSTAAGITHTTSGPAGDYHFSGLAIGEYSLEPEMAGYTTGGGRVVQLTTESSNSTVDLVLIRSTVKAAVTR